MKIHGVLFFRTAAVAGLLWLALAPGVDAASLFFTNGPLTFVRVAQTTTLLSSGKLLVAGGYDGTNSIAISELYDPATGLCATNGALAMARHEHTATLLMSGKVLVAGGLQVVSGGGHVTQAIVATGELYDPVSGTWSVTGTMNTPRLAHTATLLTNGMVLVTGGEVLGAVATNSAEIYNPAAGTWTPTGSMTVARYGHTATLLSDGTVLVTGGLGTSVTNSAEIYSPVTGRWSVTGSMMTNRYQLTATMMADGRVLVVGGYNNASGVEATAEIYNPTNQTWAFTGSLHAGRSTHAATLLPSGKVMVTAGNISGTSFIVTNSAELYDPVAATWSVAGRLNTARAFHTATLLPGGQVVVAGGETATASLNSVETCELTNAFWTTNGPMARPHFLHTLTLLTNGLVLAAGGLGGTTTNTEMFNPATSNWTATGSMNVFRYEHTATLLWNGQILAAGGYNGTNYLSSVEVYNASNGVWTVTNSMNVPRGSHTATLLLNGKVLAAGGGTVGSTPLTNSEIFDPSNGTWTVVAGLHTPRQQHTGVLLPNGKVLVTGGLGINNIYLSSVETYDPASNTWTTNNPMSVARTGHTATLLPNGKVLVAGGFNEPSDWLTSAEIYDPAAGTWTLTGPMNFSREFHTATLLPSGQVLVAAGLSMSTALKSAEIYDPATGVWVATNSLNLGRYEAAAALLPGGKVLVAGGVTIPGNDTGTETFDPGLGYSNSWQPVVTSMNSPVGYGSRLAISGEQFRGVSEASGGNGSPDSPADYPLVQMRGLESGRLVYETVTNWTSTFLLSVPVTNMPMGWAMVTMFVNGIPSQSGIVNVTVGTAFVTFSNLTQTYDGTAKSPTVTTIPPGLAVTVTYNGSTAPPTNVGSYALSGVIDDTNYMGGGIGTFQIVAPVVRNFGVDASHFQNSNGIPETNWAQMFTQGDRFAFVKASEGLTGPDDATMTTNVANATQAGLLVGVYHVAHPENRPTTNGAVVEADHLLGFAGSAIGPGMLRPVLDIETGAGVLSPTAMSDWVLAFSQEIVSNRGAGAAPIVYCLANYAMTNFDSQVANTALWISTGGGSATNGQPSTTGVFTNWAFWQYSVGSAGGISPIDLDVCHDDFVPLSAYVIPSAAGGFHFSSVMVDAGGFHLSFTNVPGTHFTLLSTTNASLPLASWTVAGTFTEAPPGQFQFTDTQATNLPKRFYRVRSP